MRPSTVCQLCQSTVMPIMPIMPTMYSTYIDSLASRVRPPASRPFCSCTNGPPSRRRLATAIQMPRATKRLCDAQNGHTNRSFLPNDMTSHSPPTTPRPHAIPGLDPFSRHVEGGKLGNGPREISQGGQLAEIIIWRSFGRCQSGASKTGLLQGDPSASTLIHTCIHESASKVHALPSIVDMTPVPAVSQFGIAGRSLSVCPSLLIPTFMSVSVGVCPSISLSLDVWIEGRYLLDAHNNGSHNRLNYRHARREFTRPENKQHVRRANSRLGAGDGHCDATRMQHGEQKPALSRRGPKIHHAPALCRALPNHLQTPATADAVSSGCSGLYLKLRARA
ncbi:hypothetical protein K504DRAFT_4482 [Pleomassaria siparia CBS 279.74]|uniref:Uncharacterized protein n=1 Tax=Pleomassaria siparia CBS 279.74 TaxID=1314801 RepID=A0A6G1KNP0_9PLEO|nr:hypothetical protein K504DRAFT_4482 [Pleomassaria siparia CBS 279.74]